MQFDVGMVLAHELVKDNGAYKLSSATKSRMDLGIKFYKNNQIKKLLTTSGHKDLGKKYGVSLAEVMKQYAIKKGVPESSILEEDFSLETVGELIFCKVGIIDPRQFKNITIITNDWHLNRTKKEADFIFGDEYVLNYQTVSIPQTKRTSEQEEASYNTFLRSFQGINKGDSKSILNRLFERHQIYSKNPQHFKTKLEKLIGMNKPSL